MHAVWLNLPAAVCAMRAAARVDHEGGLQGPAARSAQMRNLPYMKPTLYEPSLYETYRTL